MEKKVYFSRIKEILALGGFRVDQGESDEEWSFIVPCGREFTPGVCSVLVQHDESLAASGALEIWVYIRAAQYDLYKNFHNLTQILLDAARVQVQFLELGYAYDTEYNCQDGTVVVGKKIPLHLALHELGVLLSLLTGNFLYYSQPSGHTQKRKNRKTKKTS